MSAPLTSISKRLIEVTGTMVADDNADNDVCFNWVEIPNATSYNGAASKLVSVAIYDPGVSLGNLELFFCRGATASGTAPTTAQGLINDGTAGSAATDITAAEGTAIVVCGSVPVSYDNAEGLITAGLSTANNVNLVMASAASSRSLYVSALWRSNPADNSSSGNTSIVLYLGFED